MLHQTLEAFGIKKSRTSAYHPEEDGTYIWLSGLTALSYSYSKFIQNPLERYNIILFVLFAYCTGVYASTGVSPMFGCSSVQNPFPAYDAARVHCGLIWYTYVHI